MTVKELKTKYGYSKRILDNNNKSCVVIDMALSKEDALKLANSFFHMNKKELIICKGYATKSGKKAYLKKKITVIGEKPAWVIYRA